jgi:SPP1 gp7 family putative phage head morphogenesis protein
MPSREYWLERALDKDIAAKKSEDKLISELNNLYKQSFKEVKKELNNWYNDYAINNSITLQEAQRLLTPIEMKQYQEHIKTLRQLYNASHNPFVLEQINKLQSRAYVTRQMALLDSIDKVLIETSNNVQIAMEDHLINMYQREYKDTLKTLGVKNIPVTPVAAVKEIINYPYAGAMFSDRIWRNKQQLLNYINDDLAKGLIKGSSIQNMSKDLMERCNTLYFQAARLVRTETNYAMTQGHKNGYIDAGLTQYEFLAEIDARTSAICKKSDGQIFNLDNAIVGTNMPPMHPNCRSTILPVIPDALEHEPAGEFTDYKTGNTNNDALTFKDKKDAAKHAIDKLGFKEVNWGRKITHELAGQIVGRLDKIFNMYPQLKGSMKTIQMDSTMGNSIASVSYGGALKISTRHFWDTKESAKMYDRCIRLDFHPKGTEYMDVITHECSHMIERITDWNEFAPKVTNEALSYLGITSIKDKQLVAQSLSKYATYNEAEFMAESFADAISNGDKAKPISKEILKIINRELKK